MRWRPRQSALQYGEWWLGQGNGSTGANCSGVLNANTLSQMQVCSNMLTAPTTLPWSARADYLPPNMTVATGGGIAASGDINYNAKPGLSIGYLGLSPDGKSLLYQVLGFRVRRQHDGSGRGAEHLPGVGRQQAAGPTLSEGTRA